MTLNMVALNYFDQQRLSVFKGRKLSFVTKKLILFLQTWPT